MMHNGVPKESGTYLIRYIEKGHTTYKVDYFNGEVFILTEINTKERGVQVTHFLSIDVLEGEVVFQHG